MDITIRIVVAHEPDEWTKAALSTLIAQTTQIVTQIITQGEQIKMDLSKIIQAVADESAEVSQVSTAISAVADRVRQIPTDDPAVQAQLDALGDELETHVATLAANVTNLNGIAVQAPPAATGSGGTATTGAAATMGGTGATPGASTPDSTTGTTPDSTTGAAADGSAPTGGDQTLAA
jgi:hypothetical protein